MRVTRRTFLRGATLSGASVFIGLPPLDTMFNSSGTAYAMPNLAGESTFETRFLFWFNGNGVPERYWIPTTTGTGYEFTPCLSPLETFRNDIHVISGLDNVAANLPGPGNGHHQSISGLISCTPYTGRGAGGASFDQYIAGSIGGQSRFRSLQVGVCQENLGENIHRNLSWAGRDRALPPELIPQNLFDRLFGARDEGWINRKQSILDVVREDVRDIVPKLGQTDRLRLDGHLESVRELERSVASLPPDYGQHIKEPEDITDLTDYPRIAKIQSDLVAHAFASGQTRVVSYMLTKGQGLTRFPWLGHTMQRHHDYTHSRSSSPEGQRVMLDICRWHVEEFAYFLGKLRSIPEGEGTLLDHTCALFVHEHAEAGPHKNIGLTAILAGHANGMKTGMHTKARHSVGDLQLTIAEEIMKAPLGDNGIPTAKTKLSDFV